MILIGRLFVLLVLFIAAAARAEDGSEALQRPLPSFSIATVCDWRQEVLRTNTWLERDQLGRMELLRLMEKHSGGIPRDEYLRVAQNIEAENRKLQEELEDLVLRCGWPSATAFGPRAGEYAFLVVQHAPVSVQKRYFPLIEAAAKAGELPMRFWGSLHDRMQVFNGKPQRFGSQICRAGTKKFVACEVEDIDEIDVRRAEIGMVPASWCAYLAENDVSHPRCAP